MPFRFTEAEVFSRRKRKANRAVDLHFDPERSNSDDPIMWTQTVVPLPSSANPPDSIVSTKDVFGSLKDSASSWSLDNASTEASIILSAVLNTGLNVTCNDSFVRCVVGAGNVTDNGDGYNDTQPTSDLPLPRPALEVVMISIVVVVLSILTAGGNLLVIVAFRMDKALQTVSNYFLLSLAVADLTIGVVSMPLYTLYLLMRYWPLGALLCDIWLALDYTMSNASVANLIIISVDRYLSITRPLTYRAKRTPRRAGTMICTAWIISVLLWTPWIFAWPYIEGQRNVPDTECYIQFLKTNRYMSIFTATAAFYIPVSIMFGIYHRIYRETRKRQKDLPKLQGMKQDKKQDGSKKSHLPSSDDEGVSSLSEKHSQSSPELDDLEAFQAMGRSTSFKNRLLSCLKIDRDSDYIEESSTSDPPASPSANKTVSLSADSPVPRANGPTVFRQQQFTGHQVSVRKPLSVSMNCSSSLIPLLPVDSPHVSPTFPPITSDSVLTTSFSRHSHVSAITPLLESEREKDVRSEEEEEEETVVNERVGDEENEADSEDEEEDDESDEGTSRKLEKCQRKETMYTVVIQLPAAAASSFDEDDDVEEEEREEVAHRTKETEDRFKPSIRLTPDSDGDSFAGINPELLQKDGDSDDSLPMVRPLHQQRRPAQEELRHLGRSRSDDDVDPSDDGSNASEPEHPRAPPPPVRPPTGTPALARRAHSNDLQKAAMQAKMAAKVAVRVRRQRARSKVALRRQERRQDQKAAKTLTAILLAFLITWTPYNIFTLVETFCSGCINDTLYAIGK